jgi:hypothetical protein
MRLFSAAALLAVSASSSAFASGIIRDVNNTVADHAAMSIGYPFSFGYSTTVGDPAYLGLNNPYRSGSAYLPYSLPNTNSGADTALWLDVPANATATSQYANNVLPGARWMLSFAGGNRQSIQLWTAGGSDSAGMYVGNTATITYTGLGNSSYLFDATATTVLTDGPTNNAGHALMTLTITRKSTPSGTLDGQPVTITLGQLLDPDVNATSTGDTPADFSGPGEVRIRYTDGANYAETLAIGATSWLVGTRATSGTGALLTTSGLTGSGNFSSSGIISTSNPAVGHIWTGITLAGVGSSVTVQTAFSHNMVAVVPEPVSLSALALGSLLALRRRRS